MIIHIIGMLCGAIQGAGLMWLYLGALHARERRETGRKWEIEREALTLRALTAEAKCERLASIGRRLAVGGKGAA